MSLVLQKNGFTVVEAIVSISVATFITLGLIIMIDTLNIINDRASDLVLANSFAENKAETLRSVGFGGLVNGTYPVENELPSSLAVPRTANYVISTVNDPVGGSVMNNLKQIDITISYNDHGRIRNLNYRTHIGELGVGQY